MHLLFSSNQSRRWLSLYPKDYLPDLTPEATDSLEHLKKTVRLHGNKPALYYFDKVISYKELDEMSDAFACGLIDLGVKKETASLFTFKIFRNSSSVSLAFGRAVVSSSL
jgi:non-ribosomal peptide synthetase component E (peptide arylation enzyme)